MRIVYWVAFVAALVSMFLAIGCHFGCSFLWTHGTSSQGYLSASYWLLLLAIAAALGQMAWNANGSAKVGGKSEE